MDHSSSDNLFSKKNIISYLMMAILILAIPVAVKLVQTQQQLRSRAAGDEIQFVESETLTCDDQGACTTTSTTIAMELTSPLGPPGSPEPTSSPVSTSSPGPTSPPPTGDSASVAGSPTATTGQAVTYTANLSGKYQTGELFITKGDGLTSFPCSTGIIKNSLNQYWCKIGSGSAPSFSTNYTFSEAGSYYAVVNGYAFDINNPPSGGGTASTQCSGNPFGLPSGWGDCGDSDRIAVTVTGTSTTVPQANLSVSSTSVTPGQTVNVTATLGGTAQYGEIFVTKGDGKTEWNCPAGTSRAGSWPNSQGEYWCKLN